MKDGLKLLFIFLLVWPAAVLFGAEQAAHELHQGAGVKIEVYDNSPKKELTVRLGPFNILPYHPHGLWPDQFLILPFDGWLISFEPRLVDDRGSAFTNKLLHHLNLFDVSHEDAICPGQERLLFAQGSEMQDWPVLPGMGIPVEKYNPIRVVMKFHNPTATPFPKTYLEILIKYSLITDLPLLKSIFPVMFYVGQCGKSVFDLKPGETVRSSQVAIRYPGKLLAIGGHLHDYGHRLELTNITRTEKIVNLPSRLDPEGHYVSSPVVIFPAGKGYHLNRKDLIAVTGTYQNPTGRFLQKSAMAMVFGYFLPDNPDDLGAYKSNN